MLLKNTNFTLKYLFFKNAKRQAKRVFNDVKW